ncbi:MAG: winged helix-turn-helix transcriptional regulator [Saprospiraceae bacterium]|nr:winged helix-turn-helix transcriptional regulator [Saprospiraceae bacterium]
MKNSLLKFGLPLLVLLTGLLAVRASGLFEQPHPDDRQFSQQVNLAMRQAADRLLDLAGDTTRTIPPVKEVGAGEYLLQLESQFSYDSLPRFLEAALAQHGIREKYHVAVLDCLENLLMLGYSKENVKEGQVPCSGRQPLGDCYNLSVSFPDRTAKTAGSGWAWWALANVLAVGALVYWVYKRLKNNQLEEKASMPSDFIENDALLRFGSTAFDPANLFLEIAGTRQPLTFREAKLLQFFVERPNQVLERDAILAAVWEDEGIIVGRSLDVFVSRLRKILQKDPSLKLANVHGVGYRLEVG